MTRISEIVETNPGAETAAKGRFGRPAWIEGTVVVAIAFIAGFNAMSVAWRFASTNADLGLTGVFGAISAQTAPPQLPKRVDVPEPVLVSFEKGPTTGAAASRDAALVDAAPSGVAKQAPQDPSSVCSTLSKAAGGGMAKWQPSLVLEQGWECFPSDHGGEPPDTTRLARVFFLLRGPSKDRISQMTVKFNFEISKPNSGEGDSGTAEIDRFFQAVGAFPSIKLPDEVSAAVRQRRSFSLTTGSLRVRSGPEQSDSTRYFVIAMFVQPQPEKGSATPPRSPAKDKASAPAPTFYPDRQAVTQSDTAATPRKPHRNR